MKNTKPTTRFAIITLLLVFGMSWGGLLTPQVAYADDPVPPPAAGDSKAAVSDPNAAANAGAQAVGNTSLGSIVGQGDPILILSKLLAVVLRAISQLLWPLLMFAGGLLKSDFLYTGAIDIKLTEMWIQVRNLVNIIYVILLLAVALYNVLGLGETVDFLEIKKALPKIIIGLLLVNFSYVGVKVVLDVVNVGTVFAFSIPRTDPELAIQTANNVKAAEKDICSLGNDTANIAKAVEDQPQLIKDAEKGCETTNSGNAKAIQSCKDNLKKPKAPDKNAKKGLCIANDKGELTLNADIQKTISDWNIDGALTIIAIKFMRMQDLTKIATQIKENVTIANLAINMLFSLVMYIVYGISFIVLIIMLFARAAVLWMLIVFSPLIVVNFTFPNLIAAAGGGAGDLPKKVMSTLLAPIIIGFVLSIGYILLSTMQNINYGGVTSLISDVPTSNLDTFQDLLIAIGSIVFIWMGIQGATSDAIGGSVAGTIMSAAQGAGQWLAKAPFMYTPIFQIKSPHSTHGDIVSLGTLAEAVTIGKSRWEQSHREGADKLLNMMGMGGKKTIDEATTRAEFKELLKSYTPDEIAGNKDLQAKVLKGLERLETEKPIARTGSDLDLYNMREELRKAKENKPFDTGKLKFHLGKAGATGDTGSGSGSGTPGSIDTFADKEANKAKLNDNKKYLSGTEQAGVDNVVKATDATYAAVNKGDNEKAAKKALAIAGVKDGVAGGKEMTDFMKKADKPADLTASEKEALKKFMEARRKELSDAGISDVKKQGEIMGDTMKEMLKSTFPDAAKRTPALEEIRKAIGDKNDDFEKEMVKAATKA